MGRRDFDTEAEFYAERLQEDVENGRDRLLAPMTRAEWYGSLAVAAVLLALGLWL